MISGVSNLNALILIGGKSTRMGTDKSQLIYYNKPQIDHIFELVSKIIPTKNIYFSVRDENQLMDKLQIIDIHSNLGPFGAIYSAFEFDKSKSWFVLAIDIPLFNLDILKLLINNREMSKIATTFQGINKKFPEPLISIWEPKSFPIFKKCLENNTLSLINILKNNDVKIVPIKDDSIVNINTIEEFHKTKRTIKLKI